MITFSCQGRTLAAERTNHQDGDMDITPHLAHQGKEELLRTADGEYYLRRRLELLDVHGHTERRAIRFRVRERRAISRSPCGTPPGGLPSS